MKNYCYKCKNYSIECFEPKWRMLDQYSNCEYFEPNFEPKGMIKVGDYVELDTTEIVRVQAVLDNGFIAYEGGVSNKFKKLD